jgi:hypothetical protein
VPGDALVAINPRDNRFEPLAFPLQQRPILFSMLSQLLGSGLHCLCTGQLRLAGCPFALIQWRWIDARQDLTDGNRISFAQLDTVQSPGHRR